MGSVDFREVMRSLMERKDVSDEVKRVMLDTIRKIARESGDTSLEQGERIEFARRLLEMREPRPVIRDRLKARFQIKKSQAYRDIEEALKLAQKQPFLGAKQEETATHEEVIVQE